jgi:hypothetical protein
LSAVYLTIYSTKKIKMGKADGKPKGKMNAYAIFVQTCRDEHKRKNPNEQIVLGDFAKKCGEKWKAMNAKEKKRFEDLAAKDKARYEKEMENYTPADGATGGKRKKKEKDPNAPKRALSAFFCFCAEERPKVRSKYPSYGVGDVAKEMAKRWEACPNRAKYEALAAKDKERYAKELAAYKKGGGGVKAPAKKSKAAAKVEESEEEEDDDDDDDDESD